MDIEIERTQYSGWELVAHDPAEARPIQILISYTYFHRKWLAEWARDYIVAESPVDFSLSVPEIRRHREWISDHTAVASFLKRVATKARHWQITKEEFPEWVEGIE